MQKSQVILLSVILILFSIGIVSAKYVVNDLSRSDKILESDLKWVDDKNSDLMKSVSIEAVSVEGLTTDASKLVRIFAIKNISCNKNSQGITLTLSDFFDTKKLILLNFTLADAGQAFYGCMGGPITVDKETRFSALNLPYLTYGTKSYHGLLYGTDKCSGPFSGIYQCQELMSIDMVDWNNPPNTVRGNMLVNLYFNNATKKFENNSYAVGWLIIENRKDVFDYQDKRISLIDGFTKTLNNSINNVLSLFNLQKTRIDKVELKTAEISNHSKDYFKYLSSTDRKAIVCGYAQDNHFDSIIDLGFDCQVTYRSFLGRERASCRCKAV